MANNYSTTSITIRSKDGKAPVIGPVGLTLLRAGMVGENPWFEEKDGEGVYEGFANIRSLLDALQDDFLIYNPLQGDEDDPFTTLSSVLSAIKARRPEAVTDQMVQHASQWDEVSPTDYLSMEDIVPLVAMEPGSDIGMAHFEAAYTCSKNRHGEFTGSGYFWSPEVWLGVGTSECLHLGMHLAKSAKAGDAKAASEALIGELKRILDTMPKAFAQQVMSQMGQTLQKEAGFKPRLIVEVDGGMIANLHHNVDGLSCDLICRDMDQLDDPDEQEAKNEALDKEAETLPFKDCP